MVGVVGVGCVNSAGAVALAVTVTDSAKISFWASLTLAMFPL